MIDPITQLRIRHGLKVAVVSKEARELNAYRIRAKPASFGLRM